MKTLAIISSQYSFINNHFTEFVKITLPVLVLIILSMLSCAKVFTKKIIKDNVIIIFILKLKEVFQDLFLFYSNKHSSVNVGL